MTPALSIVIPTLGRADTLRRTMDHLQSQEADPESFELIVVIDKEEREPDAIAGIARRAFAGATVLAAERAGASAARNLGWHAARGELVLFIDDDVLAGSELVTEHLRWHHRYPEVEVGVLGSVRWARELRVTPFMRWLERGVQFDYERIEGIDAGWGRFYTANVSVKREMLESVGGFEEERLPFGYEDLDLAYRMSEKGFRLLYNHRAAAEHLHPMDLDFWRRRIRRVAFAEHEFARLHPEIEPYFRRMFSHAAELPRASGRGITLARWVPRWIPWLGPRVWTSVDIAYKQALAPDFLEAWTEAGQSRGSQTELSGRASTNVDGRSASGPK